MDAYKSISCLQMDVHTSMYGRTYINLRLAITNDYKWMHIHLFHNNKWMYIVLFMDAQGSIRLEIQMITHGCTYI